MLKNFPTSYYLYFLQVNAINIFEYKKGVTCAAPCIFFVIGFFKMQSIIMIKYALV